MMGRTAFTCTEHISSPVTYLFASLTSHSQTSFIINVQLSGHQDPILALINSGATSNFIDSSFISTFKFPCTPLVSPIALCLFDGKPATSGFIHEYMETTITFSESSSQMLSLLVTKLHPLAPIVLRLLWLRTTNPTINWDTLSLTFPSGTASMLLHMTVAMACTTIDLPMLLDTIPELHTALMAPPPSVSGPPSLLWSLGYIPNAATENPPNASEATPNVSNSSPNISGSPASAKRP